MNLREALLDTLTKKELEKLITSFDIIGDVAIIEIPRGLGKKQKKIAHALISIHKNVHVVAKKLGSMEGKFRVRPLKIILGESRTETEYKESGCKIKLDVAKVYFSVRLSHERERIAQLIKPKENVLVMFAGVGPFALVAAKKNQDANIVGIELNPIAAEYFKQNIRLNKLKNCQAIQGDVRKVIPDRFIRWADRILMPLPKSAEDFLDVAFIAAKNGAVIHFYNFGKEEIAFEEAKDKIKKAAAKNGVRFQVLDQRIVRPYAPRIVQVATDFRIIK